MIRKIRRNITEAATGKRLNRYGSTHANQRAVFAFIAGKFLLSEYLKHRTNRKAVSK